MGIVQRCSSGVVLAAFSLGATATGSPLVTTGPLQSAFVDMYPDQLLWTREDWHAELALAKAAGIQEIIIGGIARVAPPPPPPSTYTSSSSWLSSSSSAPNPSTSSGVLFLHANVTHPLLAGLSTFPNVMDNIINAAAEVGLTVVIGLVRAGYSALPFDRLFIGAVADASAELLGIIAQKYKAHPSVCGIYLPQELANGVCVPGASTKCTVCCSDCTCCFEPEAARHTLVHSYLGPLSQQVCSISTCSPPAHCLTPMMYILE